MIQPPEEFDSIFRYIVVVSQRAEQLINGAKARAQSRFTKPTLQARDDVEAGEVNWRVLTQEELDAQRQAMVEQFRAEVDAASEAEGPIPDVLPTTDAEMPAAEGSGDAEERDEELERLQRLLGMARGEQSDEAPADEEDVAVDLENEVDEESAEKGEED